MKARQAGLAFIFVTLVLDVLGIGIVIPILPELIATLRDGDLSTAARSYGWFVAVYAAMQFLFAPLLGNLSDRYGRRPVILLALLGTGLDYLLLATAPSLTWLFVGRVIAGITGASFTAATAYIADVSLPDKRAQNFGLVAAAFGLGFIIGPIIGGVLGTLGPRVPFYATAALTLLNALYGFFVLPESLPRAHRRPFVWRQANPLIALRALGRSRVVLGLTGIVVFATLAQQALQSTFVLYTAYRFGWSALDNGAALALYGAAAALMQAVLLGILLPRLGEQRALLLGLSSNVIGFVLYGLATQGWMMYAIIVASSLGFLVQPVAQGIISKQVGPDEQGALQGALTSLISLTAVVGPILATSLFSYFTAPTAVVTVPGAPFFGGAVLFLGGMILALATFRRTGAPAPAPIAMRPEVSHVNEAA
jgi:MFS transporter, DHA1 family, tetracycline resistance protein